MVNKKHLAG